MAFALNKFALIRRREIVGEHRPAFQGRIDGKHDFAVHRIGHHRVEHLAGIGPRRDQFVRPALANAFPPVQHQDRVVPGDHKAAFARPLDPVLASAADQRVLFASGYTDDAIVGTLSFTM